MQLSEMKPIVDRIVKRRCSPRIEQDVAGLTLLRLCEALSSGFEPTNPIGFVSTVTSRAIVDTLRFERDPLRAIDADLDTLVDPRPQESPLEDDELFGEVASDETDKKILYMRHEGLSFREIAERLQLSKSSVDRRITNIQRNYADVSRVS